MVLRSLVTAAAWAAVAATPDGLLPETAAAAAADDECQAADEGCALHALQMAGRSVRAHQEGSLSTNQTSPHHRLTIVNGCPSETMWIAHIAANRVGPDPQDMKLLPGQSYRFTTAEGSRGLVATRFWPKLGCDAAGNNCAIGDSGGPGEACVVRAPGRGDDYSHCAPPVDSKFEATFAPPDAPSRDTVDMSLVDGYSVPFKLEVNGDCTREGNPFTGMDCSGLSLGHCPDNEMLNGQAVSLKAVSPHTHKVVGCYSPCMRLTDDKWNTPAPGGPASWQAAPYCCAGGYGTPVACQAGPIMNTQYLRTVHRDCPAAYGYAYDDKSATIVCTATTEYTVTFLCPDVPI